MNTTDDAGPLEVRSNDGLGMLPDGLSRLRPAFVWPNVEHNRRPQGVRVDGPVGPQGE